MAYFNWLEDFSNKGQHSRRPQGEAAPALYVIRAARLYLKARCRVVVDAGWDQKMARLDLLQPSARSAMLAVSLFLVIPVTALGQSSGGAIRGTITDPSGAVI